MTTNTKTQPVALYKTFGELFSNGFKIDWGTASFLSITHLLFLVATPFAYWFAPEGLWKVMLAWTLIHVLLGCLATTAYSHRLVAHGAAGKIRLPVHVVFCLLQILAVQGSVLRWATMHIMHHGVDRTGKHHLDPYSATWFTRMWRNFFWSHMLTYFFSHPKTDAHQKAEASKSIPVLLLQDKYYVPLLIALNFLAPMIVGFWLTGSLLGVICMAIASVGGFVLCQHNTWTVNSITHMWGERAASSSAKNNYVWMGPLGEGNHHADHHDFGKDYRNGFGLSGWLLDPTRYVILFLRLIGQVKGLRRASKSQEAKIVAIRKIEVVKAKVAQSRKASSERWAALEQALEQKKADWIESIKQWEKYRTQRKTFKQKIEELRKAYDSEKLTLKRKSLLESRNELLQRLSELKWDIREAKLSMQRRRQEFFHALRVIPLSPA